MSELLTSLRADLLSRRLLPLVVLAIVALAVAIGYALAGSSSESPVRGSGAAGGAAPQAAIAVTAASPNPNAAEAETPGGVRYQTQSALHDPFAPLPSNQPQQSGGSGGKASTSSPSAGKGSSGSGGESAKAGTGGTGSSGGTGAGTGGGKAQQPAPTPAKPSKPKPSYPYDVSILFGQLPADGQPVTLPPYQSLQPQRPLPSAADARIALERVNGDAKSAIFELLQPPILRGQGLCLPSPAECQRLALEVGKAEELEYVEASGQAVVYELKTVSVVKRSSQTAG